MPNYQQAEHEVILAGPAGDLQAKIMTPTGEPQGIAVVCHPHPLYEGTMDNKVVTTLVRTFRDNGLVAARFNFRGVGKSQGEYGEGWQEVNDALAVLDYMTEQYPGLPVYLAGFSFGAFVSAYAASQRELVYWLGVAPPAGRFDLEAVTDPGCPRLVIIGEADEVVDVAEVKRWVAEQQPPPKLITLPEVSHFFHSKLVDLKQIVEREVFAR